MQSGEMFDWLRRLKQEGRFAASRERRVPSPKPRRVWLKRLGVAADHLQRVSPQWSDAFFAKAAAKGVALIIRFPLASGLLSGKSHREINVPENDHRNFNRDGQRFNVGETFAAYRSIKGSNRWQNGGFVPVEMTLTQFAMADFGSPGGQHHHPGAKSPKQSGGERLGQHLPALVARFAPRDPLGLRS